MASPQSGHEDKFGPSIFLWVRRLSRLDLDVFRFGTAMSNLLTYRTYYDLIKFNYLFTERGN
jgi:hypothetical protein